MMELQAMRALLADMRAEDVAEKTEIHPNTVRMIRDNPNCNPTLRVLKALSSYLETLEPAKQ